MKPTLASKGERDIQRQRQRQRDRETGRDREKERETDTNRDRERKTENLILLSLYILLLLCVDPMYSMNFIHSSEEKQSFLFSTLLKFGFFIYYQNYLDY